MQHIPRMHGISISVLHEFWTRDEAVVLYERSALQRADIFTNTFRAAVSWQHAFSIIGMCLPPVNTVVVTKDDVNKGSVVVVCASAPSNELSFKYVENDIIRCRRGDDDGRRATLPARTG